MKSKIKNQKAKGREKAKSNLRQIPKPKSQIPEQIVAFVLSLLLSASTSVFAQQNGSAPMKNPYTGNAAAVAEGKELYKKMNCYGCHGMQGGGGMGPSLIDEAWKTGDGSDRNLLDQILNGKGQMPPYKTMVNDDQAWKLVAFIRSLYKGDPKKITW
jgi:cytochrome c(L)